MRTAMWPDTASPAAPTGGAQGEAGARKMAVRWRAAKNARIEPSGLGLGVKRAKNSYYRYHDLIDVSNKMHGTYTMKQACNQKPDVLFATPHTPLHNDPINILICIVSYIHNGHWMNMFMRVQRTKVPRAASNGGTSAVKNSGGDGTRSWIEADPHRRLAGGSAVGVGARGLPSARL